MAQALVRPGERLIDDDAAHAMKFDLRAYAYDGDVQSLTQRNAASERTASNQGDSWHGCAGPLRV